MSDVSPALAELLRRHPLPLGWNLTEEFADTADVCGLKIQLSGLVAERGEQTMMGSAAHPSEMPLPRAYFELLERILLIDAIQGTEQLRVEDSDGATMTLDRAQIFPASPEPERWQYSKSNGVALGQDWTDACHRAQRELIERDLVLRSWCGQLRPQSVELPAEHPELSQLYELESYVITQEPWHAGVFVGWPKTPEAPLLIGFGAAQNGSAAARAAYQESLQRLGFLWGEEIPQVAPEFSPTPDYHQEYYLWPQQVARLRAWLRGEHLQYAAVLKSFDPASSTRYVELGRVGELVAVKAISSGRLPLSFGLSGPQPLPEPLRVHPIC